MPLFFRSHDPIKLLPATVDVPPLPGVPAVDASLPPVGPLLAADVQLPPGRPAGCSATNRSPSLWLTDDVVPGAPTVWRRLVDQYPGTGLWPLLLTPLDGDGGRPWDSGELDPVAVTAVEDVDVAELLVQGWAGSVVPIGGPTVHPSIERALTPFGAPFPGLSPALPPTAGPTVVSAAALAGASARFGLVSCLRPADAVALIGWQGAINRLQSAEVSAVLRSWEDRFGVVLVGLGFATLTVLVPHPPQDEAHALRVAAEIAAFCPDALWQGSDGAWLGSDDTIAGLSRLLRTRSVWRLWFD